MSKTDEELFGMWVDNYKWAPHYNEEGLRDAFLQGLKIGRSQQWVELNSIQDNQEKEIAKLSEEKGVLVGRLREAVKVIKTIMFQNCYDCIGADIAQEYLKKYSTDSGAGEN